MFIRSAAPLTLRRLQQVIERDEQVEIELVEPHASLPVEHATKASSIHGNQYHAFKQSVFMEFAGSVYTSSHGGRPRSLAAQSRRCAPCAEEDWIVQILSDQLRLEPRRSISPSRWARGSARSRRCARRLQEAAKQPDAAGTRAFREAGPEMADKLCALAEEDEARGRMISAGDKYGRAAIYY